MADVKCPSCGKTNPESLEICQFCGALLKMARTEPLAPISPGQFPEKMVTSDLERTLPGWLRDVRRAGNEPVTSPIPQVKVPQDAPPPSPPPQKAPDAPLDLLAGLSQAGDDDEEVPDWLKNLQGESPAPAAPAAAPQAESQETPDWLADLKEQPAQTEPAPQPEAWGFSNEPTTFNFDESEEPAQSFGDTPDWLTALETQESAPQQPQSSAEEFPTLPGGESGDTPDWLASLGGLDTVQPESAPVQPASPGDVETPGWLSSLGGFETASPPQPESAPPDAGGDLPDWLADLQSPGQSIPEAPLVETPTVEVPSSDTPDWLSGLQETAPTQAETPAAEIPSTDLPDWMSGLQETAPTQAETPAAEIPSTDLPGWMSGLQEAAPTEAETPAAEIPSTDLPDWMSGLQESAPSAPESVPSDSPLPPLSTDLPDWLSGLQETAPSASESVPPSVSSDSPLSKPFQTGALDEFKTLESEPVPDFLSGLVPDVGEKKPETEPEAQPGELPDWLAGMAAGAMAASLEAEPTPSAESEKPVEPEAGMFAFPELDLAPVPSESENPAPGNEGIDSLLLDVPDWLSGFTPSVEAEQPGDAAAP